jgi:hypothetical protein
LEPEVSRLSIALAAYVVLGILAWTTMSDERFRLVTLAILAMFAVKTLVRRNDVLHPGESEKEEHEPM